MASLELELDGLRRRYGTVTALDGLTFDVPAGLVFGFLGPNGAGKTTTMRAIFGVAALDAGKIRWWGRPADARARQAFGYMPEERGLYPAMRLREQLEYFAQLHDLDGRTARAAARTNGADSQRILDLALRAGPIEHFAFEVQLLIGKVLGIGLLALGQAAAMVIVFIVAGFASGSSLVHGPALGIVLVGGVFLVLGCAFYCTAFAAAGSLVSRQSDVYLRQPGEHVLPGARLPDLRGGDRVDGPARDADLLAVDPAHGPPHQARPGPPPR